MKDYQGLCAVFDEIDAQHREALPHIFRDPGGTARSRTYIASIVNDENAHLWIAEREDRIVGLLHIAIRETRDIPILVPRRYADVETLVVLEEYRRRGIGRALMQVADRWALEQGIERVELHVWEFNQAAQAFYEALGYRTASRKLWRDLSVLGSPIEPDSR